MSRIISNFSEASSAPVRATHEIPRNEELQKNWGFWRIEDVKFACCVVRARPCAFLAAQNAEKLEGWNIKVKILKSVPFQRENNGT